MTRDLQAAKYNMKSFGDRLRIRRKFLNLSQEALGVLIGLDESCSRARISRYELGIHEPDLITAKLLANRLRIPVEYLYCERDLIAELILLTANYSDQEIELIIKNIKI